ncbi:MAG: DNA polymerase III subunit delta, partial [Duncaniella sp.]|nr:DNA polymerase III subunit delta [Duncaniella sp.]
MTFSEIPSHDREKRHLKEMVASGRVAHALLIHGPAGVGKFMLGRALAQRLHCLSPTADGDACGKCPSCRQHASFNHVDMLYVFPVVKREGGKPTVSDDYAAEFHKFVESHPFMDFDAWVETFDRRNAQPMIYVDESDLLADRMAVTPTISPYKIALIWLPERLRDEAANKLLKLIEEPFAGTIFILVSDDAAAVMPTIRSRCRPVEGTRLRDETIAGWLSENRRIDPA